MQRSRIKAKLAKNEPVLVTALSFSDPSIFELTSLMGFDGIWLDLEHHAHSVEAANSYIRAARVGVTDVIARPAKGEFMRLARLLEAGARGIMYPRCDDAREAAEVVRWSKFAPLGTRGIDGANPDMPYCSMPIGEYIATANEETFLIAQIESPGALEHVESIAEVPGIDLLLLGPGDFSVLSGVPGQVDHPDIRAAKQRVAAAARSAGKHWATICTSPKQIEEALEMGAGMVCYGSDILSLKRALEQIRRECEALGFSFDGPAASRVTI